MPTLHHQPALLRAAPQPYGNLADQAVQRFATYEDLAAHKAGGGRCNMGCATVAPNRADTFGWAHRGYPACRGAVRWCSAPRGSRRCSSKCAGSDTSAAAAPGTLQVTIEEREEYEQHLKMGTIVYAGGAF